MLLAGRRLRLTAISLTSLNDGDALGSEAKSEGEAHQDERSLIERRYTKPCARFLNGVRLGFGFRLERTCREWNCKQKCGEGSDLFHRLCRFWDFKDHQDVILKSAAAIEREKRLLNRVSHTTRNKLTFRTTSTRTRASVPISSIFPSRS